MEGVFEPREVEGLKNEVIQFLATKNIFFFVPRGFYIFQNEQFNGVLSKFFVGGLIHTPILRVGISEQRTKQIFVINLSLHESFETMFLPF